MNLFVENKININYLRIRFGGGLRSPRVFVSLYKVLASSTEFYKLARSLRSV